MFKFHVARLADRSQIVELVRFIGGSKKAKGPNVMYRELSTKRGFIDAANTTREVVACPSFKPACLPRTMYASALGEWAILIVPMLLRITSIVLFESIAYALACFRRSNLSRPGRTLLFGLQFGAACSRACTAFVSMAAFDEVDITAVFTSHFGFRTQTGMRAKARVASGLINRKRLAASLANMFNLFDKALPPTFATAILLVRLFGRDFKDFVTGKTMSSFHVSILA